MRAHSRFLIGAIVAATVAMLLTACGGGEVRTTGGVPVLRYQGWASQVVIPELAEELGFFDGKVKLEWQGNTISGPQDIQSAATGQVDFGGAFGGAVAKLAQGGAPITAVLNYYGSDEKTFTGFYVPENSLIKTPKDLLDKKIGVNTLGGQSEADIHTALEKSGFTDQQIKSVQLVVLPPAEHRGRPAARADRRRRLERAVPAACDRERRTPRGVHRLRAVRSVQRRSIRLPERLHRQEPGTAARVGDRFGQAA
ncbi:ABC transporter substrate-binding protein [Nocardia gipuzkoensis]